MKKIVLLLSLIYIIASYGENPNHKSYKNTGIDTVKLKEVVVTGTQLKTSKDNISMSVSVIDRKEIEKANKTQALSLLPGRIPGLFLTERGLQGYGVAGGSAGKLTIRGVGADPNTQVLILLDGHPQFMGIMGHPLPDTYISSDIERIEVIRGPSSILYGTNAMGGVINFITRQQENDGVHFNGKLMYGSFNSQKISAGIGYKKDKFNLYTSFNHDQTDGARANSDFKIDNGYIKANYNLNKHFDISGDFSLSKFKSYDPGPAIAPQATLDKYTNNQQWIDIQRGVASLILDNEFEKTSGSLRTFYNFGEHKIYDGFHSTDNNYGFDFFQALKLIKNNTITLGVDYKNYGGMAENNGKGVVFTDTTVFETGVYGFIQHNIKQKLTVNFGFRLENNNVYGNELVPQGGITYKAATGTVVKLNAGKGFRSPTLRELFMWGTANANLLPERMYNYEAGIEQYFLNDKLCIELTLFRLEAKNIILSIPVNGANKFMNTGEFTNNGLEFSGRLNLLKNLNINATYSYVDLEKPVLSAPRHIAFMSGIYNYKKFAFNAELRQVYGLYTRINPDTKIDHVLLNAGISYKAAKYIQLFLNAENITDRKYEINYNYPMPGITLFGGINIKI